MAAATISRYNLHAPYRWLLDLLTPRFDVVASESGHYTRLIGGDVLGMIDLMCDEDDRG